MRKLASHRVLFLATGVLLSMQVVEIDSAGSVVRVYPLCGEEQNIEWLPGLLLLSPVVPFLEEEEHFNDFVHRMKKNTAGCESDCKLYWVTPFDVASMEVCAATHILPLKG